MTELEHIEIEGFKGLEHVEFEPTDINLITGRNNTGKTSLLEAIELSRDPKRIRRFGENVDAVVNHDFSEAVVITESEAGVDDLVVRPASAEESDQYLRDAFIKHFQFSMIPAGELNNDPGQASLAAFSIEDKNINARFQDVISRAAARAVTEIPDSLKGIHILVEIGDREFPYLHFNRDNWKLKIEAGNVLRDILTEEFGEEHIKERKNSYIIGGPEQDNQNIGFEPSVPRVLDDGLFLKEPPESEEITSIISERPIRNIEVSDSEGDAVRVDDIGDFVKEKDIVDQLKTFSLDTLIFETEDGEKQPVPYEFMGDGFKSMVGLLWELMDDEIEDQIVLIEEPETHMHPGYVAELVHFLIDLARDENIQFFITTHDHDFIKDFFMDMPEEKREYLEDEFSLVKMDDFGADVMEYEEAEHHLKDLHLDLRGI